ncbi:PIG-L family deacetylase [Dokdonella soli]|uniref:PIG-L family deacetylase n=1 Tax=Dokdonella soli TaxID=529810 RepID=A0ABN1IRE1_9GAMM
MTASLLLSSNDRLLVFAPHPDDETLATGALIQSALAAGAALRVVFATDGDNNPWPQRWLERRWRIGPQQRARWGERRRREATAALAVLGVDMQSARFLGWPDQGLTDDLMRDDRAIVALADEIAAFAPTHVALPALGDRHPDHSALRVMFDLALLRAGRACVRLGYVVHGDKALENARVAAVDAAGQHRKQQAMLAHLSQIALSRRRLLALAARPECFDIIDAKNFDANNTVSVPHAESVKIRIPHRPGWALHRRHELLVVLATKTETLRFRFALPRLPARGAAPATLIDTHGRRLPVEWTDGALILTLPAHAAPLLAVYAKLDRVKPRLNIFDRECWHDTHELLQGSAPFVERRPAAGLT